MCGKTTPAGRHSDARSRTLCEAPPLCWWYVHSRASALWRWGSWLEGCELLRGDPVDKVVEVPPLAEAHPAGRPLDARAVRERSVSPVAIVRPYVAHGLAVLILDDEAEAVISHGDERRSPDRRSPGQLFSLKAPVVNTARPAHAEHALGAGQRDGHEHQTEGDEKGTELEQQVAGRTPAAARKQVAGTARRVRCPAPSAP
jgi:hypothetical protein